MLEHDGRKDRTRRNGSLAAQIRDHILDDVVRGVLAPGSMIQLAALAERYQVSKTPVREALGLLQRDQVVESLPYKGYLVRPVDLTELNDIYLMRELLEAKAAELAATTMTEEELAELTSLEAPAGTSGMSLDYDGYAHRFHGLIARASRSRRLADMIDTTYTDVRRLQYSGVGRPVAEASNREHDAIVEALRARDPLRAGQAMAAHIRGLRARALE
jgi:GntR family transcriptional regulator, rspAB operon transcriptional repressor